MRIKCFSSFLVGAALLLSQSCSSQEVEYVDDTPPSSEDLVPDLNFEELQGLSFSGFGKKFYQASSYDLHVGVMTRDKDVLECSKKHQAVLVAVDKYMSGYENVEYSKIPSKLKMDSDWRDNQYKVSYYEYQTDISIRCRDISKMAKMQAELVSLGVNQVKGASVFTENAQQIRNDARDLAIKDALSKVDYIKQKMGWESYRISAVQLGSESSQDDEYSRRSGVFGGRSASGSSRSAKISGFSSFISANITLIITPKIKKPKK